MMQIVFDKPNSAVLWDTPDRPTGAGEVRVRMAYTALSAGTERANLVGDPNVAGARTAGAPSFPRMLGYSGSGIVEEIGENVSDLRPGDRVIARWGCHREYNTLPACNVMKIPSERISMADASFVFISTFALAAVRKCRIELGESCLVVGLGLLGMFSVQYARLAGAMPVIAADFNAERRALALKLGADCALDPSDADYAEKIRELTRSGADTAIEVTGSGDALNQALLCTAPLGRVSLLGCTRTPPVIDLYHDVHFPGIALIGAHTHARPKYESYPGYWTERDDCDAALRFLASDRLDIRSVIHEIHAPEDAPEVYGRLARDPRFPIGIVFKWT
ncbi:MAG: zinc-dependent alcohol dehydrogenase [Christensenellales bacterium]|jgi:threonine dehydrogenase-like Zn-dependent dehydrogenase